MIDPARISRELAGVTVLAEALENASEETRAPIEAAMKAVLQSTLCQFDTDTRGEAEEEDE